MDLGTPRRTEPTTAPGDEALLGARLVARRKPGQWISAALVLVIVALVLRSMATNPHYQWDVVAHFFLRPSILDGLALTLWLTAAVLVCGYLIGIVLAVMRLSDNPVLKSVSLRLHLAVPLGAAAGADCCSGSSSPRSTRRSRCRSRA
ncbi:hypothetical protein [Nocardioides convexus]|uniref:hypothetical protein n=1 Tax=Nocardioides convexus TaxID=2712224 RepID=UPI002418367B|nr:hypothetical protein [Nocardioides convexus]